MTRRLLFLVIVGVVAVAPAFAQTAQKDGGYTPYESPWGFGDPSPVVADWEYNTGGVIDYPPTTGGSATGWGEWFIGTVLNDSGQDLMLTEFGFPCSGPPTGPYGWILWYDMGGYVPPAGPAASADAYGAFTPVDPNPDTFPPVVYTYIDVSGDNLAIGAGTYFCFGYDNTGTGGQTEFNGVQTWAWYTGVWDPDINYGRTAILQVKGDYGSPTPTNSTTWGAVKALYK